MCVNEFTEFLNDRWQHLLDFNQDFLLHPTNLAIYSVAIRRCGSPSSSIFGFIDCTICCICRPTEHQRQAYNGHKKVHSLEFQAVVLPNGMFGHLFGPVEGRRNNAHLLAASGLMELCALHAVLPGVDEDTPIEDQYFQVFGNPAYGVGMHIQSPFSGAGERTEEEQEYNRQMAAVRIEVEHAFGIVQLGVLLTNALNCFRPNQVSQYFDCRPPSLSEYFHH
ncbi:hypothetical protein FA95DRAFT_1585203 [Auriscalpium vulgare]|uniref:Uncharacterized protein n=1 Tax=Auriscalpium vulgare TaxID=40419 RepID=A0ACB8R783_9AGAM|nr:hypothetical protein FA95DRAFT_1585203 [Auriscalpium vulgare]